MKWSVFFFPDTPAQIFPSQSHSSASLVLREGGRLVWNSIFSFNSALSLLSDIALHFIQWLIIINREKNLNLGNVCTECMAWFCFPSDFYSLTHEFVDAGVSTLVTLLKTQANSAAGMVECWHQFPYHISILKHCETQHGNSGGAALLTQLSLFKSSLSNPRLSLFLLFLLTCHKTFLKLSGFSSNYKFLVHLKQNERKMEIDIKTCKDGVYVFIKS